MSDSGSTQTPAAASIWRAPAAPASVSLGPAVPGVGVPAVEVPGVDAAPSPRRLGWTPPPRRGLVPLRPIPLGQILGAPFRLQRRAPRITLGPALVISLVTTTLAAVTAWALVVGPQAALDAAYYRDFVLAQNLLGVLQQVGGFVPLVLALAGCALLAGPVVVAASRAVLAERVSYRGLRWRLTGRTGRLVGWTVIVLLVAAGVLALASLWPMALAVSSSAGSGFAFLAGFLEAIAIVLIGGYLTGRLGFTSHVIAIEGLGVARAIGRSWRLTRRSGWRLFGVQLLVGVVVAIAAGILALPIGWALDLGAGLVFPTGPTTAQAEIYLAVRTVVLIAVSAVVGAFGLILQSACAALLYLDQRMRVEGLDLALARYVDERQRGMSVADPFPGGGAS